MSQDINLIDTSIDYYFTEDNINKITIDDLIKIDNNNINNNIDIDFMIKLIAYKNVDQIRELLEMDNNIINLTDKDNDSLLHLSVFSDSYELSRLFLKYGANPNRQNNEGQTPLFRIVFASNDKIIGLLLEYGAFLDIQDKQGNTPLHIAVLTKNYKIIKSLLDYGVNPLIYNNNHLLSLDFAISKIDDKFVIDDQIFKIFAEYIM